MIRQFVPSRVALGVAAALVCPFAVAQDNLEETVVTATRTPVPADAIGAPVIVITRADIERSLASDVSEILETHAGLEVARSGGPGQTTSLFMRGTDSNHTVVLVDGVRINPGTIGGAALENIAPESIERIEIVKGPRSSLYGTDAIGGVVQLFTRGANKAGFNAGASYGTDDTRQWFGDGTVSPTDQLRIGFGGSYADSDGMPTFVDDKVDRGYRNVTGRLTTEFAVNDSLTLRARGWRAAGRSEYTEQTFGDPPYVPVSQDFEDSVYSAEADYHLPSGLAVRGTVSQMTDFIDQNQPIFGEFDYAHTRRNTYDAQIDLPRIGAHAFSFGVERSDENTRALSFGTGFDEDTGVTQAFAQDQFNVRKVSARLAIGAVDHETFGNELTWNAEIGRAFDTGTRVTLSGGKAFRAPDSTDRFGFGGNADLKPEVSRQMELSIRQKLGEHQQLTFAAFDNRIRDLIDFVITDPLTFDGHNENVDRVRIKGLEFGWQYASDAWHARAELTLQDPRHERTDERLLRRSRQALVVAVDRDVGALDVGVDVQAIGNRRDGFPVVTLDSYTLVNAGVRYRATSALTLQGRVENAFDENYTLVEGYRTRGRAYTVGVRYSFE